MGKGAHSATVALGMDSEPAARRYTHPRDRIRLIVSGPNGGGKTYFISSLQQQLTRQLGDQLVVLRLGSDWDMEPEWVAPLLDKQIKKTYTFGGSDPMNQKISGLSRGNQMLVLLFEMLAP